MLGDPVSHSKSPAIHTHLLSRCGIDGTYEQRRTAATELPHVLEEMREGRWQGLNITMPHKKDAAALVDELTETARVARSVNTITWRNGELTGHTTDASALTQLMQTERFADIPAVLVLGTGGSARAVLAGLPAGPVRYVSARDEDKAATIGGETRAVRWGTAVAGALVINCTPLGMRGEHIPDPTLRAASGLIDLPYGRDETPSVRTARERGLAVADGREFLIRQALVSFSLWTGEHIDYESVSDDLRNV